MVSSLKRARQYAYSSARANAMKSRLLDQKTMHEIAGARDMGTIISALFERDYRQELEEFGGLKIKSSMVDFALSKNLAKNIHTMVRLSQGDDREIMQGIAGKWDLSNIRLAIEAKSRKLDFDSIARYLIDVGRYNASAIKEAMREDTTEGMISRLMINSPYRAVLASTLEAYRKNKSAFEAITVLDREYYGYLSRLARMLSGSAHYSSSKVVRMEIDTRNILTLIKAKRLGMKFAEVSQLLVPNGNVKREELEQAYSGSADIAEFVSQIKQFDLKNAVDSYRKDSHKQLLTLEIGLKGAILSKVISSLGHSILTFGTMLAYVYMKEIEVSTLRVLINGKAYGLEKEEIERLIGWKAG